MRLNCTWVITSTSTPGSKPAWRRAYSSAITGMPPARPPMMDLPRRFSRVKFSSISRPDDEGAVAGGELAHHLGVVLPALVVDVNRGFRAHQADVRLAREQGGHGLVGAAGVGQLDGQALLLEVALFHGDVLGGVEHRMGHLG